MNETKTRAEQLAHHEAEARRLKAELDAERGLVEGSPCWVAYPNGKVIKGAYYRVGACPCFPYTDDGKRKAERAALLMSSLNFEDPPFEIGQEIWVVNTDFSLKRRWWVGKSVDRDAWHQGRIHATEAEALAWRDKFNDAWTQGAP